MNIVIKLGFIIKKRFLKNDRFFYFMFYLKRQECDMLFYYVVNVFINKVFSGNFVGVVVLNELIKEDLMQKIVKENKLFEIVFILKEKDLYKIRWFILEKEVDLCGYVILVSIYVILCYFEDDLSYIIFFLKLGFLEVIISGEDIILFFIMVDVK